MQLVGALDVRAALRTVMLLRFCYLVCREQNLLPLRLQNLSAGWVVVESPGHGPMMLTPGNNITSFIMASSPIYDQYLFLN